MTWQLWQETSGDRRPVTVHAADAVDVPRRLRAVAVVQESGRSDTHHATFIQYDVPEVGTALAWVGVPGAGPGTGTTSTPRAVAPGRGGELRHAVRYALDHHRERVAD